MGRCDLQFLAWHLVFCNSRNKQGLGDLMQAAAVALCSDAAKRVGRTAGGLQTMDVEASSKAFHAIRAHKWTAGVKTKALWSRT